MSQVRYSPTPLDFIRDREEAASTVLGISVSDGDYIDCPGKNKHTKASGRRDCRLLLDGGITVDCFHTSCTADRLHLRDLIWSEINNRRSKGQKESGPRKTPEERDEVSPAPKSPPQSAIPEPNLDLIERMASTFPADRQFLRAISPIDPLSIESPEQFLDSIFLDREIAAIIYEYRARCDYLHMVTKGSFRVSSEFNDYAKEQVARLPRKSRGGAWFMSNPVNGKWVPNGIDPETKRERFSRRCEHNMTCARYLVLESDLPQITEEKWISIICQLDVHIQAIYTSGGKSIHALLRLDCPTKSEWDGFARVYKPILASLGADPKAVSAVRMTRLPNIYRRDKKRFQELLFLRDARFPAETRALSSYPRLRDPESPLVG